MSRRWVLPGLVALLAVSSLTALAFSSNPNERVSGAQAALAARAAIAYSGGQWATIVRPGAPGVQWQFHVLRRDGSVTDVLMDENLELIDVGDSPSVATGYRAQPSNIRVAQAAPTPSRVVAHQAKDTPISPADHDRAAKAALEATHGGQVRDVDEERDHGAAWEVEVIANDGHPFDVLLDAHFKVIEVSDERDGGEPVKSVGHDHHAR